MLPDLIYPETGDVVFLKGGSVKASLISIAQGQKNTPNKELYHAAIIYEYNQIFEIGVKDPSKIANFRTWKQDLDPACELVILRHKELKVGVLRTNVLEAIEYWEEEKYAGLRLFFGVNSKPGKSICSEIVYKVLNRAKIIGLKWKIKQIYPGALYQLLIDGGWEKIVYYDSLKTGGDDDFNKQTDLIDDSLFRQLEKSRVACKAIDGIEFGFANLSATMKQVTSGFDLISVAKLTPGEELKFWECKKLYSLVEDKDICAIEFIDNQFNYLIMAENNLNNKERSAPSNWKEIKKFENELSDLKSFYTSALESFKNYLRILKLCVVSKAGLKDGDILSLVKKMRRAFDAGEGVKMDTEYLHKYSASVYKMYILTNQFFSNDVFNFDSFEQIEKISMISDKDREGELSDLLNEYLEILRNLTSQSHEIIKFNLLVTSFMNVEFADKMARSYRDLTLKNIQNRVNSLRAQL